VFKKLLRKSRLYCALSYAYDAYAAQSHTTHDRSAYRHIGPGSEVRPRAHITHPGRVWIGERSTIMGGTFINSMGGLHVGNFVGIGMGCTIVTFNHRYRNAKTIPFDDGVFLQPVIIRDYAWIGWESAILPGVEVGEGAIVAMGSVVTPLAIVIGNPAETIGYRSKDHFEACKAAGRVMPHRVLEVHGKFDEIIALMTQKRYARELRDLGMLPADTAATPGAEDR
jgi:acetyltransferase-like isoleucine patch superfamily enzyme